MYEIDCFYQLEFQGAASYKTFTDYEAYINLFTCCMPAGSSTIEWTDRKFIIDQGTPEKSVY